MKHTLRRNQRRSQAPERVIVCKSLVYDHFGVCRYHQRRNDHRGTLLRSWFDNTEEAADWARKQGYIIEEIREGF